MRYVGRFAPSPTGPLHLGSLLTAVASFLVARQRGGNWLVRIEDIDPPREVPGAAAEILRALDRFGLHWDGQILYQSTRLEVYRETAERLLREGLAYRCRCSRSVLRALQSGKTQPGRYPGTCRHLRLAGSDTAIRLRAPSQAIEYEDALQGPQHCSIDATTGDYVIFRRDELPAYHLAVVIDDAAQGVTDIVRGVDLLDSTPQHLHLQTILALPAPTYSHLPVLVDGSGHKLSKQTGAPGIDLARAETIAFDLLGLLGLTPPRSLRGAAVDEIWAWAAKNWDISGLARLCSLAVGSG